MGLLGKNRGKQAVGAVVVGGGLELHVRRARINGASSGETAAIDSLTGQALVIPAGAIHDDCFLDIATPGSGTIDVGGNAATGAGDDPNGLLEAASLQTAGSVVGSLAAGAVTRGALLRTNGYSAASPVYAPTSRSTDVAMPVTYTCSTTNGALKADIVVVYRVI